MSRKPNEILVHAFVDVADVIQLIPKKELVSEINRRFATKDLDTDDFPDIYESDDEIEERVIEEFCDGFGTLQARQLFDEFKEALKNQPPMLLFDIFGRLNRPGVNPTPVTV